MEFGELQDLVRERSAAVGRPMAWSRKALRSHQKHDWTNKRFRSEIEWCKGEKVMADCEIKDEAAIQSLPASSSDDLVQAIALTENPPIETFVQATAELGSSGEADDTLVGRTEYVWQPFAPGGLGLRDAITASASSSGASAARW